MTGRAVLDTDETAALFGVTPNTLRQLARRGLAPVEPLRLGRILRWPTALVMASLGITEGAPDDDDRLVSPEAPPRSGAARS